MKGEGDADALPSGLAIFGQSPSSGKGLLVDVLPCTVNDMKNEVFDCDSDDYAVFSRP